MKPKGLKTLNTQVNRWNATYPVGTLVKRYRLMHPRQEPAGCFKTRLPASVLSGHSAVVWLDGFPGCVDLDSLEVMAEGRKEKP